SEILLITRQAHAGCRVPDAANADDRIEQQPGRGVHRALALELRNAIEQRGDVAEVVEKIADAGAHDPRGDVAIAAHRREHYPLVQTVVEVVHAPVQRLPRVMDVQSIEGGTLELTLIQPRVEFQRTQWVGEAVFVWNAGLGLDNA